MQISSAEAKRSCEWHDAPPTGSVLASIILSLALIFFDWMNLLFFLYKLSIWKTNFLVSSKTDRALRYSASWTLRTFSLSRKALSLDSSSAKFSYPFELSNGLFIIGYLIIDSSLDDCRLDFWGDDCTSKTPCWSSSIGDLILPKLPASTCWCVDEIDKDKLWVLFSWTTESFYELAAPSPIEVFARST